MLPAIKKRTHVPSLADHFFGHDLMSSFFNDGADYTIPAVNIRDTENGYEIEMAVPGLSKKDIRINLENELLTVSSENKDEKETNSDGYMRREFSFTSFSRTFSVPEIVDTEKIKATQDNGLLRIELPKLKEEKVKKNKSIKIS